MAIVNSRCVLFTDAQGAAQFRVIGSDLLQRLTEQGVVTRLGTHLWRVNADLDNLNPPQEEAPKRRPGRPKKSAGGE